MRNLKSVCVALAIVCVFWGLNVAENSAVYPSSPGIHYFKGHIWSNFYLKGALKMIIQQRAIFPLTPFPRHSPPFNVLVFLLDCFFLVLV